MEKSGSTANRQGSQVGYVDSIFEASLFFDKHLEVRSNEKHHAAQKLSTKLRQHPARELRQKI